MPGTIGTRLIFVSVFKCECGAKKEFWHHGCKTEEEAVRDIPISGECDGWKLTDPIRCAICRGAGK